MNDAIKGYLFDQRRPLHLQPRRQDGGYPWIDSGGETGGSLSESMDSSSGGETASANLSNTTAISTPAITTRKRRIASIGSVKANTIYKARSKVAKHTIT